MEKEAPKGAPKGAPAKQPRANESMHAWLIGASSGAYVILMGASSGGCAYVICWRSSCGKAMFWKAGGMLWKAGWFQARASKGRWGWEGSWSCWGGWEGSWSCWGGRGSCCGVPPAKSELKGSWPSGRRPEDARTVDWEEELEENEEVLEGSEKQKDDASLHAMAPSCQKGIIAGWPDPSCLRGIMAGW